MHTLFDLALYILVVIAMLGYHELYNHLAFFKLLFRLPLKQMIENDPTRIIIAKGKCSVKDCLCLRARDSSNYPGQHGDDYAVFLPLCHANYTFWGARIVSSQPINTPVAPLDSELLRGFFRKEAMSLKLHIFPLPVNGNYRVIRASKCTIRMLMLTSPFQIANVDTGGVSLQQLYHFYITVS